VRDYVYPCSVVLGGLLVLVGALLWLPICFLSTLVVGCMWSADALWQYRQRRIADARNAAAKGRKGEAPASSGTRRLREKEKRRACKKTMRHVGRIRRTWREMNEKIDAKHGKMVGMVCRPATHHFMCSAIGVGWYAVVLLVSLLVANLVVLDIDTMVAGWIGAHLLGLATHVGKCIHAFSLPCVVHHFSCMWSEGVYNKFIVANVVLGPVQSIVAPMRVYPRKPTLEQQRIVQERR